MIKRSNKYSLLSNNQRSVLTLWRYILLSIILYYIILAICQEKCNGLAIVFGETKRLVGRNSWKYANWLSFKETIVKITKKKYRAKEKSKYLINVVNYYDDIYNVVTRNSNDCDIRIPSKVRVARPVDRIRYWELT